MKEGDLLQRLEDERLPFEMSERTWNMVSVGTLVTLYVGALIGKVLIEFVWPFVIQREMLMQVTADRITHGIILTLTATLLAFFVAAISRFRQLERLTKDQ